MSVNAALSLLVAIFSGAAAVCWLRSALARVAAPAGSGPYHFLGGEKDFEVYVDGVDIKRTAALQAKWNRIAAAAASVAALIQFIQSIRGALEYC